MQWQIFLRKTSWINFFNIKYFLLNNLIVCWKSIDPNFTVIIEVSLISSQWLYTIFMNNEMSDSIIDYLLL